MPELPEVETVVATLRPRLLGSLIQAAQLSRTDICSPADVNLPALLTGKSIVDISRRAKRIVFALDSGERFYIHLGMTGRLVACPCDAETVKHTHLVLELRTDAKSPAQPLEVRFIDPRRFGGVFWLGREGADGDLGPEPLTLRPAALARRLAATRRPIKSALLDQSLIAGLGNIYVDESLFLAGLHPLTRTDRLRPEQVTKLSRAIKQTLRRAIKAGGSSIRDYVNGDGDPGSFQLRHNVYDREGFPCRRCKTPIRRIVLTGRSTHFCPACQKRR
jgi:formamidopyrimidine-DNA glycosylase